MFGLKYKNITRERAFYMCVTDKGLKAVKKATSADVVILMNIIKTRLEENGILTNKFCVSNSGLPYVVMGNDIYTVSDYISQNSADFSDPKQFCEVIRIVAQMHSVCQNVNVANDFLKKAQQRIESFSPQDVFYANQKALKSYKKLVMKKSRISDFDMVLLNNYEKFMTALENWFAAAKLGGVQLEIDALHNRQICHNLLKEENILFVNNKIYLTGFSEASVAHRVNDLAALIKRYIKARPQEVVELDEVLNVYNTIIPLDADEKTYFKSLLLFPDKFFEICGSYYSKKRAFTPRTFETRMEALIDNYDFFENYTANI